MIDADDAVTDARVLLRVRNLPGVLSLDAVTALLQHYGATDAKLLRDAAVTLRAKRAPQTAIAAFQNDTARASALARLDKLELAGHRIRADVIDTAAARQSRDAEHQQAPSQSDSAVAASNANASPSVLPPLPPGPPPSLPPQPLAASGAPNALYTPAPLAPHLGLHYAPSPLLEYKYPRASESVVRNIANALMALPKFYTQVLHLMNKMNLPPPFEDDAIPGAFSREREAARAAAAAAKERKRKAPSAPAFTVEEDDDSDGDDPDESELRGVGETLKRPRMASAAPAPTESQAASAQARAPPLPVVHVAPRTFTSRPKTQTSGFAKAFAASALGSETRGAVRPGVISAHELERQRVPSAELLQCDAMADYDCGEPSRSLRVLNIAASVDEQDLAFVFGCVLPLSVELSALQIVLSDAPTKSATVTFPTLELATAALAKVHGVALDAQPLVVSYAEDGASVVSDRTPAAPGTASAQDGDERETSSASTRPLALSREELDARRLDAAALADERFMKNYARGDVSSTLYVKNLAKDVTKDELLAVFRAALPRGATLPASALRHFTEGRMKCQAFVEFASPALAEQALDAAHGVVVNSKPLIVCFRKSPPAPGATAGAANDKAHGA